jgi:hypothetical protein
LLFAYLRQATGGYGQALHLIAGMLAVSLVLPVLVSPPRSRIPAEGPEAQARFELEPADPDAGQHR